MIRTISKPVLATGLLAGAVLCVGAGIILGYSLRSALAPSESDFAAKQVWAECTREGGYIFGEPYRLRAILHNNGGSGTALIVLTASGPSATASLTGPENSISCQAPVPRAHDDDAEISRAPRQASRTATLWACPKSASPQSRLSSPTAD